MLDYINIVFVHYATMLMYNYFNPICYWFIPFISFILMCVGQTIYTYYNNDYVLSSKQYNGMYTLKEYICDVKILPLMVSFFAISSTRLQNIISSIVICYSIYKYIYARYTFAKNNIYLINYNVSLSLIVINFIFLFSYTTFREYLFVKFVICFLQILLTSTNYIGFNL